MMATHKVVKKFKGKDVYVICRSEKRSWAVVIAIALNELKSDEEITYVVERD